MKHYVIATQQEWGVKAFDLCVRPDEKWMLLDDVSWRVKPHSAARLSDAIRMIAPRYVFALNWSSIVPPDVLEMAEIVNFHSFGPSVQPMVWHRGGGPIEGLLLLGYTETMIGAHRMTTELDAGPIYGVSKPVSLAGTKVEILDRFVQPVVELVRFIVEHEPEPYPQVGEVVRFSRLPKDAYEKFWRGRA
jgi:methionyl-tRNA formyltransferase